MAASFKQLSCRHHPDATLIEDYRAGDMICSECGLVVGDRVVDVGTEWRTFSNEKSTSDPSRVGAAQNPLLEGESLTTMIERVAPGNDSEGYAKYHNRSGVSGSDRSLMNAFREIGVMADRINLPRKIVERANQLFKQVHEQKSLKGRSNDAIASACLYIACRQEGVPRTLKEICAISKISKKEIGRCFKLILKAVETSVEIITTGDFMNICMTGMYIVAGFRMLFDRGMLFDEGFQKQSFVLPAHTWKFSLLAAVVSFQQQSRFCSNLNLPSYVQKGATHIARKAVELDLVPGRSPISVAAAAIYMASQASEEKRSQKEIGDIAGVADVTIRQSYRLIYTKADQLFPQDFKFATPIDKLPNV